ncbi:MAG TPA: hypothetical protein VEB21_05755 [Terriglobales bacterium]|nr:hypothetical protein [Terriglobales bacterium]
MWKSIKKLWMAFADVLGRVQTAIMLSLVYHLTVGPLSVFARVARKQVMTLSPDRSGEGSYAVELPPISSTMERAKRQF